MIKFIGDLSEQDAEVLKEYASKASNILEFGVGGSTQILSNYCKNQVISIDTSLGWVEKTKQNIDLLEIKNKPLFYDYDEYMNSNKGIFDFIFDDGIDSLRDSFAIDIWPYLTIGGFITFHDTRRMTDIKNVTHLIETYFPEIGKVVFNYNHSNITIVEKKVSEPYINWGL